MKPSCIILLRLSVILSCIWTTPVSFALFSCALPSKDKASTARVDFKYVIHHYTPKKLKFSPLFYSVNSHSSAHSSSSSSQMTMMKSRSEKRHDVQNKNESIRVIKAGSSVNIPELAGVKFVGVIHHKQHWQAIVSLPHKGLVRLGKRATLLNNAFTIVRVDKFGVDIINNKKKDGKISKIRIKIN